MAPVLVAAQIELMNDLVVAKALGTVVGVNPVAVDFTARHQRSPSPEA